MTHSRALAATSRAAEAAPGQNPIPPAGKAAEVASRPGLEPAAAVKQPHLNAEGQTPDLYTPTGNPTDIRRAKPELQRAVCGRDVGMWWGGWGGRGRGNKNQGERYKCLLPYQILT